MNVLVVVPTYNERENLPLLAAGVLKYEGFRMLVVDDGSPDGTGAIADRAGTRASRTSGRDAPDRPARARPVLRRRASLRAQEGTADFICQMDADLSHNPEYLPDLVAAAATQDLVIGSRYLNGVSVVNWPLHRIFLSAFGNRYIRLITSLSTSDCTSGFRCWRREALGRLPIAGMVSDGYAFLVEMLYKRNGSGCESLKCRSSSSSGARASRSSHRRAARIAGDALAPRLRQSGP